ncbi:Coenzyme F420 hydrogenase/dehydrogenase, beta subunit C-terminal domain [uncultured Oscillibacter sp.]|uniref:Coenzyme F420 hydrogenase/dehydrogenase, beta subunit C-terminal domain n=1 Tax=uncultured Oscillibacter sp. TaxID=876091 RepID=UPI0025D71970|nr:Coenzyme F420 hydrogenase/dehydrogenase, beta subunit C-terminal domain [uncultured Oscillibacter sp.]
MIHITRDDRCCGCGACSDACPTQCITMREAKDGFRYPVVDAARCVDCGACERACPYLDLSVKGDILRQPLAYAARSRDEDVLAVSSSGGIFFELARAVLHRGGTVFGAVWGERFDEVRHCAARSEEELHRMQGSKYLQSDVGRCYSEARGLLRQGGLVLFSGTPCQIAGLLSYLGPEERGELLTCDLICHGVPTPLALRRCIESKERETGKRVVRYYRDKSKGWKPAQFTTVFDDGTSVTAEPEDDIVNRLFSFYIADLRNTCYACRFERLPRVADISLGDYFVEKAALDLAGDPVTAADDRGMSLITVNTEQGRRWWQSIEGAVEATQLQLHTVDSICLFQGPGAAGDPSQRVAFYDLYERGLSIREIHAVLYGDAGKAKKLFYKIGRRLRARSRKTGRGPQFDGPV